MNVHTGELSHGGPYNRNMPMTNREMLKAKLQKDKFMTKPLSEIVASETEVCVYVCVCVCE